METCLACSKPDPQLKCAKCKRARVCSHECWSEIKEEHYKLCGSSIGNVVTKKSYDGKRHIEVKGENTVRSTPDAALVSVSITSHLPQVMDAQGLVGQVYKKTVIDGVMRTIDGVKIDSSSYTTGPFMIRERGKKPRQDGYIVKHTVTFRTLDPQKAGPIINAFTRANLDEFNPAQYSLSVEGITYTLQDDNVAQLEALEGATKKAMAKVKVLASAANLGKWAIDSVVEDPQYHSVRSIHVEASRSLKMANDVAPFVSPGVIETTKSVKVVALFD